MAAVGVEVAGSWFPTSGLVGFFIALLLLSLFLTALCSQCTRRSFELGDPEADKDPSVLIKVAKLEEVQEERENPTVDLRDETNLNPSKGNAASFTPWRRHLEAPQNQNDGQANGVEAVKPAGRHSETAGESNPEEETPAPLTLWRAHLKPDENISTAPDNIYHTIGGGGSGDHATPRPTNRGPGEEPGVRSGHSVHVNTVYAHLSMSERPATPPPPPPPPPHEELEEEVPAPPPPPPPAPPLPDRRTLEG